MLLKNYWHQFLLKFWDWKYRDVIISKYLDLSLIFPLFLAPFIGIDSFIIIFFINLIGILTIKQNYSLILQKIESIRGKNECVENELNNENQVSNENLNSDEPWSYSYSSHSKNKKKNQKTKISICRKLVKSYEETIKLKKDENTGSVRRFLENAFKKIFFAVINFRGLSRMTIMLGSIW